MENTKIVASEFEETISYENVVVRDFWEQQNEEKMGEQRPEVAYRSILDSLELARQTVCIITDSEIPIDLLKSIQYLCDKGVRVYLISNDLYNTYSDTIVGKCLIRYSRKVVGTMVLIDPVSPGDPVAYVGSDRLLTDEDRWGLCVKLNKEQINEAYYYFCWNFWRMTDYEVAVREDINKQKKVEEAPFDLFPLLKPEIIFYNDTSRDILTKKIISIIEGSKKSIVISAELIEVNTEVFKCLIKKIEQNINCTIIAKLDVRNKGFFNEISNYDNVSLFSFRVNLEQFLVSDNVDGIVFTSSLTKSNLENGSDNTLCFGISLDSSLIKDLSNTFKQSTSNKGRWKYQKEKSLSDIKGKRIIRERADGISIRNAELVQDYQEVSVGSFIVESLRDLKEGKFSGEFTTEGLVKKVKYKYTLQPKLRNSNFKKSELYDQWSRERQRIISYINSLRTIAEGIEQKKSSLRQQLSDALKRVFVAKDVVIKPIIKQINELDEKIKTGSFDKEECINLSEQVNEIYKNISRHEEEITVAIDKDRKEQEWLKQKENLENEISQLNEEIQEFYEEVEKLSEEKEEKKKSMHLKRSELQKTYNDIETEVYVFLDENKCLEEAIEKQESLDKLLRSIDVKIKEVKSASKKQVKNRFEGAKALVRKEVCAIMNDEGYYDNKMIHMVKQDGPMEAVLNEMKQYVKEILYKDILQALSESDRGLLEELESKKTYLENSGNELNMLENDINTLTQKSESDSKFVKGKIDKKEMELSRKQDSLEKMGSEFKYENNSTYGDEELKSIMKKGNKNNQQTNNNKLNVFSVNMPSENLPQAGILYQQGSDRQLAITYWSELEIGEKEALRLNAELVCEREA